MDKKHVTDLYYKTLKEKQITDSNLMKLKGDFEIQKEELKEYYYLKNKIHYEKEIQVEMDLFT